MCSSSFQKVSLWNDPVYVWSLQTAFIRRELCQPINWHWCSFFFLRYKSVQCNECFSVKSVDCDVHCSDLWRTSRAQLWRPLIQHRGTNGLKCLCSLSTLCDSKLQGLTRDCLLLRGLLVPGRPCGVSSHPQIQTETAACSFKTTHDSTWYTLASSGTQTGTDHIMAHGELPYSKCWHCPAVTYKPHGDCDSLVQIL